MFKRKIMEQIHQWKVDYDGRSCLLIKGARRVGKTTVATEFAKNNYRSYALIDFSHPSSNNIKGMIQDGFDDLDELFREISRKYNVTLHDRNSVIILDEVQLFPLARQLVKHLVADGRYDYIETGSLISLNNESGILNPSEEHPIEMYPMDFEEFCWATGNDSTIPLIKGCFESRTPLGRYSHESVLKLYCTYMLVGGMPASISAFVQKNNYAASENAKKDIISLYENDSEKLVKGRNVRGRRLFNSIPISLSNRNKIFKVANLESGGKYRDYSDLIDAMNDSMMCNMCFNITDLDRAYDMYVDDMQFKMYLCDTGLLFTQSFNADKDKENEIYDCMIRGDISINEGMYFENMVAQELRAKRYKLRCFTFYPKSSSTNLHEIDFIIPSSKGISVVEVKSGKMSSKHASLDHFIEEHGNRVKEIFVIHSKDLRVDGDITYLPIYMTMFL